MGKVASLLRKVPSLLQRDLHSMRVGTWDSFTHKKEGGSFFLLKSEMGLLRRCWNRTSLKLRRSFGSNSDGKERGLALCGLVPGCCDNGLKERQRMG